MIIHPAQIARLVYINWVLVRHGLDEIILAAHLFRPIRFLVYLSPWYWQRRRHAVPRGVRIRRALEELGPIFVKFGQILSTRRDLLPEDVAEELAHLQDRVPPFSPELSRRIIEEAYGHPLEQAFARFEAEPMASASIAQVHAAELHDGRQVVVKVVRPNIRPVIQRDLGLLKYAASLAERYWSEGPRLRPREVVAEFEKTLFDELDLLKEAANASQLRRNFQDSEKLYVPEVYWPLTRPRVMVVERIYGTPISAVATLVSQGIDMKRLAERGVEIFFTQVFRHNFFHADMHPGNVFVSPEGQYIAVDFGIMGTLNQADKRYLAENFLAFFRRDYRRVAELHVESGWVPRGTREDEFEAAIRAVCEPIFDRPLKDISFGQLLLRLFQTARRFNMPIQPQLVLLQKTLLNIEGLGRDLYPELDLWQTAQPFLEEWMREQVGTRALWHKLRENLPHWAEEFPEIPRLLHATLRQASDGELAVEWKSQEFVRIREEIRTAHQRILAAITGLGLLLAALLLAGFSEVGITLQELPLLSWVLGGLGVGILGYAWWRQRPPLPR